MQNDCDLLFPEMADAKKVKYFFPFGVITLLGFKQKNVSPPNSI
jgi:hypothetical protein